MIVKEPHFINSVFSSFSSTGNEGSKKFMILGKNGTFWPKKAIFCNPLQGLIPFLIYIRDYPCEVYKYQKGVQTLQTLTDPYRALKERQSEVMIYG